MPDDPSTPKPHTSTATADRRGLSIQPVHELRVLAGQMLKPHPLIDVVIKDGSELTLTDRRIYNKLLRCAHGPQMTTPGAVFRIPIAALRDGHMGNERIAESIRRLMQTIVVFRLPGELIDGQVQLLGWNNFADAARDHGLISYRIEERLCQALHDCYVYARLELDVMQLFRCKYSFGLYESMALRQNLRHKQQEYIEIPELRDRVLQVARKKYTRWPDLRRNALMPALQEVNELAPFNIYCAPQKSSGRVVGVHLAWEPKARDEQKSRHSRIAERAPRQGELFPEIAAHTR